MGGKFILVDFSCLLNKFFYGFSKNRDCFIERAGETKYIGSLKGFTFLVERLYKKYPEHKVMFIMDGRCVKKDINENYKADREDKKEIKKEVHSLTPHIINILSNLNHVTFSKSEEHEADDLIANVAFDLKERNAEDIIIYSSDKDFWQLAKEFRISNDYDKGFKFVDSTLVFEKFGVSIDNVLPFRVLDGDKSDNLKAPVAFVKTEFKRLFSEIWIPSDPNSLYSSIDSFVGTKWEATAKKYLDVVDVLENYTELMDLTKYSKPENRFEYKLFKGQPNRDLIQYYELRQFESFLYDYFKEISNV